MNEINEKLEKFERGPSAKSIRTDLSKGTTIFSEETSRDMYEMGNMELITNHGRQIMPKPWMHEEEQRKTAANLPLHWTDGRTTRSTELLNWCTVGLKCTSSVSLHLQD